MKNGEDRKIDSLLRPADWSGFVGQEKVKNNPEWKLIPIIVLSNLGGDKDIKQAINMGADDYFIKAQHPIEEVIDKVKEYLVGNKPINHK